MSVTKQQTDGGHVTEGCTIDIENQFGPLIATSCLDGFDFTLLFEETILTILPLCTFSRTRVLTSEQGFS